MSLVITNKVFNMNIKILDEKQQEQEICVIDKHSINSSAILNLDVKLNNIQVIDMVNNVVEYVESEKLLSKYQKKVKDMGKRNTLIISEYDEIKDKVFKNISGDFKKVNALIQKELMKLQILGKTDKVYNEYDFWYTHNDQKLEKMISNYNTLKTYQEVYNEVGK